MEWMPGDILVNMEWIKCSEKLPPQKDPFIGTDGKIIFVAYWCNDSEIYKVGGWENCYYCGGSSPVTFSQPRYQEKKIIYWMTLPEKPKEV